MVVAGITGNKDFFDTGDSQQTAETMLCNHFVANGLELFGQLATESLAGARSRDNCPVAGAAHWLSPVAGFL